MNFNANVEIIILHMILQVAKNATGKIVSVVKAIKYLTVELLVNIHFLLIIK